ncbi:4-nitrophenyl phosphatase [Tremella mesenterica]|uniref:4-nitrophenylphosphatase n=1 Tax=Tremella mesenterica TaxID=5217 RepID=A0A4V1M2W9_TREME|nr:4-nitrophenyl phosphatase [Tremella mesenterica]
MSPPRLSTPEEYRKLVDSVDTFLLDCDGVIYHGPVVVPGVKKVLEMLRKENKRLIFVTNNASKSRRQYKATFDKLGIPVSENEIFGSAYASAVFLRKVLNFAEDKKVYVIGQDGLEQELESVGIKHVGGTDPEDRVFMDPFDFASIQPDPSVGAVLCGFDGWLNYKKLCKAYTYLNSDPNCHFLLTNQDKTFPTNGTTFPGSGSMSYPLVFALSGRREPTIIGKPNKHMMDAIIAEHQFDPKRALMVGDNLLTDIEFGINSGIRTLLVMGGVSLPEQVFGDNPSHVVPTYVMESLGDLAVLAE